MQEENTRKVNINWFPGHMTKAKREMQEKLKLVDMVIECRDARIPYSSRNPLLDELIQQKPRLIVFTKMDKADKQVVEQWIEQIKDENTKILTMNLLKDNVIQAVTVASKDCMKVMIERQKRRGINPRAIRAMVVGIPNVGKSTLINRIAKKKAVQAADRPGVTKALQWVKVNRDLELLDTPGVLWPHFDDEKVAMVLAVTGAIRDQILPIDDVCEYAMRFMIRHYPHLLAERYGIEVSDDPFVNLERIAKQRHFVLANHQLDMDRTIQHFIREVRDDSLGRICWEFVDENEQ